MDKIVKLTAIFGAIVLALSLTPSATAQGSCTAGNLPAGSYRQTCTLCNVTGGNLTASCRKIKATYNSDVTSTLYGFAACRSGIENLDGFLTCAKGDAPLPAGSYGGSCRDLNVEKNMLYATCRNVNGDWKPTNLSLNHCNYQIYNIDGTLACTLPYGTYQRTCQNARVVNNQLYAQCRSSSGSWINSSTPVACNRDLTNDDGHLKCL